MRIKPNWFDSLNPLAKANGNNLVLNDRRSGNERQ